MVGMQRIPISLGRNFLLVAAIVLCFPSNLHTVTITHLNMYTVDERHNHEEL